MFPFTYHSSTLPLHRIILPTFRRLQSNPSILFVYPNLLIPAFKRDFNLHNLLFIVSFLTPPIFSVDRFPSSSQAVSFATHPYISNTSILTSTHHSPYHIIDSSICISSNVIYLHLLLFLFSLYIGQTGVRLADLFAEPL